MRATKLVCIDPNVDCSIQFQSRKEILRSKICIIEISFFSDSTTISTTTVENT